jgi:hypothetical protein
LNPDRVEVSWLFQNFSTLYFSYFPPAWLSTRCAFWRASAVVQVLFTICSSPFTFHLTGKEPNPPQRSQLTCDLMKPVPWHRAHCTVCVDAKPNPLQELQIKWFPTRPVPLHVWQVVLLWIWSVSSLSARVFAIFCSLRLWFYRFFWGCFPL